jgi:hypothetical protein
MKNFMKWLFPPKRYLANLRSKEVHDLENEKPACSLWLMSEKNKKLLTEKQMKKYLKNGFNGCRYCMKKVNTDK